ncbi:DUF2637 domain-containing protein [Micromonospora inyonensis]|uniref:DUF2637 domain-containing protein n=1 Tax=Micromonospora inyonensis TaxID=47866 RepID=A0A1C6RAA1_9ACTN|nr:DUF2637 domain-containing protein [Micromonospora inyonensis]SCL14053.1 Protein of unknown function [Micromonospora inyonensis]
MTAPTINGTRYPQPVEDLLPAARALELPEGQKLPSRNRLMREFHIGAPKADALRALLMNEGIRRDLDHAERDGRLTRPDTRTAKPVPVAFDFPEPIGPDPADDRTEQARTYNLVRGGTGGTSVDVTEVARRVADNPEATDYVRSVARDLVDAAPDTRAHVDTDHTPTATNPPRSFAPTKQVTAVRHPGAKIAPDVPAPRGAGRGWAYVGVVLGGVVSIAANVAHTYLPKPPPDAPAGWVPDPSWSPSPLAVALSVFWPVALFVAVEILTRIPWGDSVGSFIARVSGVLPVAVVAAVVSYRHLSGLLAHFGEDPLTVAIGPLAVDGLMVMASAALLVTGRRKTTE